MTLDEAIQSQIIDKLKGLIIANDMVATKELLDSVRFEKKDLLQQTTYDIIALDYIVGLNDGVAPLDTPDFTDFKTGPSIKALQTWIDAKGLDLNPFAVRANIIKFGTTWYRQGGSNIVTDSINAETFNEAVRMAAPDLQNKIKDTWQLLFKNSR